MEFVGFKLLSDNAKLPTRGSPESAGLDLYLPNDYDLIPGKNKVYFKLAASFPPGTYGRLACRSSIADQSIILAAGVLDPDFQGEIKAILHNYGSHVVKLKRGERIVQLICEKYCPAIPIECDKFDNKTDRGIKGFGSTGK